MFRSWRTRTNIWWQYRVKLRTNIIKYNSVIFLKKNCNLSSVAHFRVCPKCSWRESINALSANVYHIVFWSPFILRRLSLNTSSVQSLGFGDKARHISTITLDMNLIIKSSNSGHVYIDRNDLIIPKSSWLISNRTVDQLFHCKFNCFM